MMNRDISSDVQVADLFDQLIDASTMQDVISLHHQILKYSQLEPCRFNTFYPKFKQVILNARAKTNWRAKALFNKIDKKAAFKCYTNAKCQILDEGNCSNNNVIYGSTYTEGRRQISNNALRGQRCLVIGGGPAGLRTAIELQLLGSEKVFVIEKRDSFSRNNVVHLWPFVIDDLKSLGAKKYYGKFCAGSIDHISIRQLQLILLKTALMIGCDFRHSCSYLYICSKSIEVNIGCENDRLSDGDVCDPIVCNIDEDQQSEDESTHGGVRVHLDCKQKPEELDLDSQEWDVIIGADGRHNALGGLFPRKEFRGRLAIAITANFINRQTPVEAAIPEISGLSFIYNQDMFNALSQDTMVDLENICYYKDDTHYFVMTAKKKSLLARGVLRKDCATTQDLLSDENVDKEGLLRFARDAAYWSTGLEPLEFALNHYGQEDCAMFDFTSMCAALNACKAVKTSKGGLSLFALVGDSLLEPFWPTGSGCARGFLSSFDAAWMCRQWAVHRCGKIEELNERPMKRNSTKKTELSLLTDLTRNYRMALSVIAERESIYRILAQTKSENLQQNYCHWTLNPHSRYPNLNRHLVLPYQVEHLMLGINLKSMNRSLDDISGAKSPSLVRARRSSKKLKSAGCSPSTKQRSHLMDFKSSKSLSWDFGDGDTESNEHFDYLDDTTPWSSQKENCLSFLETDYIPSDVSWNSIESRKEQDCLGQRRRKAKLNILKDRLIEKFNADLGVSDSDRPHLDKEKVIEEFKRWKNVHSGTSGCRELEKPLFLLNSIRRCASFEERIKCFEAKLVSTKDRNIEPDRIHVESVRDLPQFATLQRLIDQRRPIDDENSTDMKRSKIPVLKLNKCDWNVKCWEDRLSEHNRRFETSSSIKNVNHDKMAGALRDRIREMDSKLSKTHDGINCDTERRISVDQQVKVRSREWVLKLRQGFSNDPKLTKKTSNKSELIRPVKKLFEDDDECDIDINKHYDHLCLAKAQSRTLTRSRYTSHLVRTRYDEKNSIVLNRPLTSVAKRGFCEVLASRNSSRSSCVSSSTGTTNTSEGSSGSEPVDLCCRCRLPTNKLDRIEVDESSFHKACLTCSGCSLSLRTEDIKESVNNSELASDPQEANFFCQICRITQGESGDCEKQKSDSQLSRVNFLNEPVNYNILYKNIIREPIETSEFKEETE